MEWKFKEGAEPQGSSAGFWYDIEDGGYIDIREVLDDPVQIKAVEDAVALLGSLEMSLKLEGLLNEF